MCPKAAPIQDYTVVAATAQQLLPSGALVYNTRAGKKGEGPLHDPTALLYVRKSDIDLTTGKLKPGVPVQPLVLRANAGDCIKVTLENWLPAETKDLDGFSTLPMIVENFNFNQIRPSSRVGLHPQLVHYDVSRSDGNDVGTNLSQTVKPGAKTTYQWYAGDVYVRTDGTVRTTPIEFGATNLIPADRVKQPSKGADRRPGDRAARRDLDAGSRAQRDSSEAPRQQTSATVTKSDGSHFREFVLLFQNDLNLRYGDGSPIPNLAQAEDAEDSGQKAFNYRTEPMWFRMGYAPETPLTTTRTFDYADSLSNAEVGGDPETPVFHAAAGEPVRMRLLHPGGAQRNIVFTLHGHVWEHTPYTSPASSEVGSTALGDSPYSLYQGARMGIGPTCHDDALLLHGAGGSAQIAGDYLFRDAAGFGLDGGLWGLLRVSPSSTPPPASPIQ